MTASRSSSSRSALQSYGGSAYSAFAKAASKFPILTREEEIELIYASREGSEKERERARERLIVCNTRLVMSIASRIAKQTGEDISDLFQNGVLGLLQGLNKFDPTRGLKISTYVSFWIKQSITRSLENDKYSIQLPVHIQETAKRVEKADIELKRTLKRMPTEEEVAAWTCLTPKQLKRLRNLPYATASLDDPVFEDGSMTRQDMIGSDEPDDPETILLLMDRQDQLHEAMEVLSDRQQRILHYYFMENLTFREISELPDIGISHERIRQVYTRSLRLLAERLRKNDFVPMNLPTESMLPKAEKKKRSKKIEEALDTAI